MHKERFAASVRWCCAVFSPFDLLFGVVAFPVCSRVWVWLGGWCCLCRRRFLVSPSGFCACRPLCTVYSLAGFPLLHRISRACFRRCVHGLYHMVFGYGILLLPSCCSCLPLFSNGSVLKPQMVYTDKPPGHKSSVHRDGIEDLIEIMLVKQSSAKVSDDAE